MIFGKSKGGTNYKFKSLQSFAWDRAIGDKRKPRKLNGQGIAEGYLPALSYSR